MINRAQRLSRAFWEEGKKRIRWIIILGIILFIFAAVQPYRRTGESVTISKQNATHIIANTDAINKNTTAIKKAVNTLLDDSQRQDRYISCILAAVGNPEIARTDVTSQCEKMSDKISLTDVTKLSTPSPKPATTTTNNNMPAVTTQPNSQQTQPEASGTTPAEHSPYSIQGVPLCLPAQLLIITSQVCLAH